MTVMAVTLGISANAAAEPLTISENITDPGDITLVAADSAAPGDDLTYENGILVIAGGAVTHVAGDNFLLPFDAGITAGPSSPIVIEIDPAPDPDPGVGGIATVNGSLDADSAVVHGGKDRDFFNITPDDDTPIRVYSGGGWYDVLNYQGAGIVTRSSLLSGTISAPNVADVSFDGIRTVAVTEAQKLLASNGAEGDQFGRSVAVSGDTAVIGADRAGGDYDGSAYVFVRDATTGDWVEQQKLIASDAGGGDYFGSSVAIGGDTVVVGANAADAVGVNSGSAYVFVRDATTGDWVEQQKLIASDAGEGDYFGSSVAIGGDTVVVGSRQNDDNGLDSGSAYVFVRDATGDWVEEAKLLASDGAYGDLFGDAVAISGDTVVVGAYLAGPGDVGSVYVFVRDATTGDWVEQQKLIASDIAANDYFGSSVAISGDTVVMGSLNAGAYVFVRDATTGDWVEQQKLIASGYRLGRSVAISGDTLVTGDLGSSGNVESAFVFARETMGGDWVEQVKLIASDSDAAYRNLFGDAVAISGDTVVVGSHQNDDNGLDSGSAYVFGLAADTDGDGVFDAEDNCPSVANPDQSDSDDDGVGDVCEDTDGDGFYDPVDNCPFDANPDQANWDGDTEGDACDDSDGDTVLDSVDNCVAVANADQANSDGDSEGDACDSDDDNDSILDAEDNCPYLSNDDQADNDLDGEGDVCDPDDDNDGVLDPDDNCPYTANPNQQDTDGDGSGDVCDNDKDGDGVLDADDNCPSVANADQANWDGDTEGDACDLDDDNDSVLDANDNCPYVANADQANWNSYEDSEGDACDDSDGDTVLDSVDNCITVANEDQTDDNGDGFGDACVDPSVDVPADWDPSSTIGDGSEVQDDVEVGPGVDIGEDTVLQSGSAMEEGSSVGDGSTVQQDATIGAGASVGDGSTVQQDATIGTDASVGDDTLVQQDVQVGDGCVIGDHTKIAKSVLLGANCQIGDYVKIDQRAQVGDGAKIGVGCTAPPAGQEFCTVIEQGAIIAPGVTIGPNVRVRKGVHVTEDIP